MTIQTPREMFATAIDALHAKEKAAQLTAFDAACDQASERKSTKAKSFMRVGKPILGRLECVAIACRTAKRSRW